MSSAAVQPMEGLTFVSAPGDGTSSVEASAGGSSGYLTCISCRLVFGTSREQRDHYKTDFHRFNLKRKVVKLAPVTEEVFREKAKALLAEEKGKQEPTLTSLLCQACGKQYSSANAFKEHLKSKRHLSKVATPAAPESSEAELEAVESVAADSSIPKVVQKRKPVVPAEEPKEMTEQEQIDEMIKSARHLTVEECLFCLHKTEDAWSNVKHMAKEHGFFIPDIEYLKDLEGLLKYLGEKISVGLVCLQCNGHGKSFRSLEAVQAHMRAVSHCKILYDESGEFDDYYDFTEDWKDVPLEEGEHETHRKPRFEVSPDGQTLHFEDGKSVGHRSLSIYYQQRFPLVDNRDSVRMNKLIMQYRALGWKDAGKQPTQGTMDRWGQRQANKSYMRLGVKGNKLQRFQKEQVLQM